MIFDWCWVGWESRKNLEVLTATHVGSWRRAASAMPEQPTPAERALLASAPPAPPDAPIAVLWSCGFVNHAYMYEPVALTLIAGFQAAGVRVYRGIGTKRKDRENYLRNVSLLRGPQDYFVWVGICEWHEQPWNALKAKGVRRVVYQSEPSHDCYGLTSTYFDELWDYSLHNIDSCRINSPNRPPILRYVPLGAVPTLVRGGRSSRQSSATSLPPKLIFLGTITHAERRQCLSKLGRLLFSHSGHEKSPKHLHSRLQIVSKVWDDKSFGALLNADPPNLFVNLHKQCGERHNPVTFRQAKLLNARQLILSERCYEKEEDEYKGMVRFVGPDDQSGNAKNGSASCVRSIADEYHRIVQSRSWAEEADKAAELFVRRFQPRDIFWRAGLYEQGPADADQTPLRELTAPSGTLRLRSGSSASASIHNLTCRPAQGRAECLALRRAWKLKGGAR